MTTVALVILILCALTILIAARIASLMMTKPHFRINSEGDFYLDRWYVIPRNLWFNVYLHHTLRDDDPQALHDHPWWNVSLVLKGGYWEVMPKHPVTLSIVRAVTQESGSFDNMISSDIAHRFQPYLNNRDISLRGHIRKWRGPGSIVLRRATDAHRLELPRRGVGEFRPLASWSLFITGPKRRTWGFWCKSGWVSWTEFVAKTADGNQVGKGCGEQG